jgi:hypothetical protein
MQPTGARKLREDDYRRSRPTRHLTAVPDGAERRRDDEDRPPVYAENGRRTITITGHTVPPRRRPSPAQSHIQARPDRIALWAFLLGLFLVFMAVATAHAAAL